MRATAISPNSDFILTAACGLGLGLGLALGFGLGLTQELHLPGPGVKCSLHPIQSLQYKELDNNNVARCHSRCHRRRVWSGLVLCYSGASKKAGQDKVGDPLQSPSNLTLNQPMPTPADTHSLSLSLSSLYSFSLLARSRLNIASERTQNFKLPKNPLSCRLSRSSPHTSLFRTSACPEPECGVDPQQQHSLTAHTRPDFVDSLVPLRTSNFSSLVLPRCLLTTMKTTSSISASVAVEYRRNP